MKFLRIGIQKQVADNIDSACLSYQIFNLYQHFIFEFIFVGYEELNIILMV